MSKVAGSGVQNSKMANHELASYRQHLGQFCILKTRPQIAKLPHEGHALSISKGVDRDRAVDESGNQLAVFGRVGARPLNLAEQQKLDLRPDGRVWNVQDVQRDFQILDPREREEE